MSLSRIPTKVLITRLLSISYLLILIRSRSRLRSNCWVRNRIKKYRTLRFPFYDYYLFLFIFIFSLWGGGLLICEKILDEDKRGPKQALLQSLSMLVATGGKERTASEYKQILDKHGFKVTQINQLDQCPFMDVILCLKKWGLFRIWTELFLPFVIEIDVYSFSKESDYETDWHSSSPNWIRNYTFFLRLFKRWLALSIR